MFASKDTLLTRPSGYNISRSVRLRSSASAYFNRTQTSGNRRTYTYSAWIKRGNLTTKQNLFGTIVYPTPSNLQSYWSFLSDNTFEIAFYSGSSYLGQLITTQVFRDSSAWYHIVVAVDTTQATSSNRVKLFVNGVQVTSFSTTNYPSQNTDTYINTDTYQVGIGRVAPYAGTEYFDGYMAEINFIDGQALTPSSFGETDSITGVWKAKKYGGTYGTNGFYLNFSDNSNNTAATIGKDYSGNGNNWTPNNISVTAGSTYDSMTDVPTLTSATAANYCVLNPLDKRSLISLTNANLHIQADSSGSWGQSRATIAIPTTGKWYWEFVFNTGTNSFSTVGIGADTTSLSMDYAPSSWANVYQMMLNGTLYNNNSSSSYGSSFTSGDILMVAFDRDNSKIYFGKNGTWFNSSDPATQTSPAASSISTTATFFPMCGSVNASGGDINFGQRPFTYTPPTGFVALNTQNLPDSTIKNGGKYMNILTWSGTGGSAGATRSLTGLGFQPDFVWEKDRASAQSHHLFDSVRGAGTSKTLASDSTGAEGGFNDTLYGYLSSFDADGFTTTNGSSTWDNWNKSSDTYVGWSWKAGGTSSSNTNGSLTSTVSVGATQGFSVCTYTAPASSQANSFGHGLGVAPSMVIAKNRSSGSGGLGWAVYHASLGANQYLSLNSTAAASTVAGYWGSGMTSTVVGLPTAASSTGYDNCTGNMVAYCFAAVKGFSAFGSYTGNGSTDGPFVYTGFRPRFVMMKRTDTTGSWIMWDTSRNTYNQAQNYLLANASDAEANNGGGAGSWNIDCLSNGFKIKSDSAAGQINASGGTYIYACFAENPFKNSLAR